MSPGIVPVARSGIYYHVMRGRRSRYTPEQKYQVVLRNLRGETQEALHLEYGISISEIQRWKQVFLEAGMKRLRMPAKSHPVLTEFRTLLQRISDETGGWKPQI
jgi:transposase